MKGGAHLSIAFITTKTIQTVSSPYSMAAEGTGEGIGGVQQSSPTSSVRPHISLAEADLISRICISHNQHINNYHNV
jgi:hypothetical protein